MKRQNTATVDQREMREEERGSRLLCRALHERRRGEAVDRLIVPSFASLLIPFLIDLVLVVLHKLAVTIERALECLVEVGSALGRRGQRRRGGQRR